MPLSYRIVVRTSAEGAVGRRVLDQLRAAFRDAFAQDGLDLYEDVQL
jgi:hypothetical protein